MKVALMQPYFFPYLGYFQLINSVDEFVIFDNAQYVRRSWMNRNRILNEHKESSYLTVPVSKAPRETKIKDIVINQHVNWQEKIFCKLRIYKNAPYYPQVVEFLNDCFQTSNTHLSELNTTLLKKTCDLLRIDTDITILSERLPAIESANRADEWGIKVSKALHATTYINAIGGRDLYCQQKYQDHGLVIKFIKPNLFSYKQFDQQFVPGLSIIDVLMFNDVNAIKEMLGMPELIR